TKLLSGKAIVKGLCAVEYIYRSTAQTVCSASAEVGWSQVVEGAEDIERMTCRLISLRLCDADIHTGSDSGMNDDARTLSLTLTGALQLALYEEQSLTFVSDLYSTKYDLTPQLENAALLGAPQSVTHRQSVREQLSLGASVRSILSSSVCCGAVTVERTDESDMAALRTSALLKVLYTDESGVTLMAQRRCEVACPAELCRGDTHIVRAQCCDEIAAAISADGIEARFCIEFDVTSASCARRSIITGAEIDTSAPKDTAPAPSLVLRRLREGECFWDLAKAYSSTVDDIRSANGITQESECLGAFLLIPRRRY
ncbi:MAG: LysM peptidoglycan-binding domain-containing protein, partial [Oscillospiraceae bacterium]|nr:LysM peptidoglycan-binding domain-containing protein [Oscillospiraceae bacterium]